MYTWYAVSDNGIIVLPPLGACVFASTSKLLTVMSWGLHYDTVIEHQL